MAAIVIAVVVHYVLFRILIAVYRHSKGPAPWISKIRGPARYAILLIAFKVALPATQLPTTLHQTIEQLLNAGLIAMVGWALINLTRLVESIIYNHYDISAKDNLFARKLRTRVRGLGTIAMAIIAIITFSAILMTFPAGRALGTSILASAGIIGLASGLAAHPVLSNLFAGLQLALTQPIRIDDVVIVDGEWGWIEEIDVTYVVVRIWDLRRLILPLSYFIQQPFQNWTYKSADLLGYVYIYTDYSVKVEVLRRQLLAILQGSPLWDGQVWNLQVTDTDERGVQLRALFSTRNSNDRWDLMVHVRESLLAFIQERYPEFLPRTRLIFPGVQTDPHPGRMNPASQPDNG